MKAKRPNTKEVYFDKVTFHRKWKKKKRLRESRNSDSSNEDLKFKEAEAGPSGDPTRESRVAQEKVNRLPGMIVRGQIEGVPVSWKIDTGAKSTFITKQTFDLIPDKPVLEEVDSRYVTASGQNLKCTGQALMSIGFGDNIYPHMVVVGVVRHNLIGEDFITKYRCNWDHDESSFVIKGSRVPLRDSDEAVEPARVIALETVLVPARHEAIIKSGLITRTRGQSSLGILTPERPFMERHGLALAKTLVDAANEVVFARVYNPGAGDVRVYKHTHIAIFTPVCRVGPSSNIRVPTQEEDSVEEVSNEKKRLPEHMIDVYKRGCENLCDLQKEKLEEFLISNQDCFARQGEVGRTNMGIHKIQLKDERPIREPSRRIPLYKRQALEDEIKQLEQKGLIEKSNSPWASQTVMVQKKDGSWRMCIDYRKLNEKTVKDAYPLTRIDENLDALEGAEWFSSLDLDMAYHQVPMAEEDKLKTAFATPRGGLYQFTTMPFGLCNAASTFERIIERTLVGLQWEIAVLYLDDIVVYGNSFSNHLENLQKVLDRLSAAGLKLKPKKCHLMQKEIAFLGHVVSKSGTRTDPAKIAAVKDMQRPKTVTQTRSFLGLASYYRKYVQSFSKIAKPLFDLTKKDHKFIWTEECETSFRELKTRLVTAPILAFPRANGSQFILDTDASNYAIGSVLSQEQDGKERVIAYGSRSLDKPERNYCVTRREMLAVVYFTKYFKHYLLGRKFLIRTDHGSLSWLQKFREPDGQIHRWIQQLSQFHFDIQHRPGNKHGNADAMSRLITPSGDICKQCEMPWEYSYKGPMISEIKNMKEENQDMSVDLVSDHSDSESDQEQSHSRGPKTVKLNITAPGEAGGKRRGRKPNRPKPAKQKKMPSFQLNDIELIRQEQADDKTIGKILRLKTENMEKPQWEEISSESKEFKAYAARWELLEIRNDVLCLRWEDPGRKPRWKICLPRSMINAVFYYLHDARTAGHQGIKKTYDKAKLSPYFWCNMQKTVVDYVRSCDICGERKSPPFKKRHKMKSYVMGAAFERVATDIAGPFPTSEKGNKYILVIGDYFTKLTEAYAIPDMQATTVADFIFRGWIKRYGSPRELHSDQGRQFESQLFQELCRFLDIKKTRTTPLHPRSDGMIERMNKTINEMLSKYIKVHQHDWDECLDSIVMVYNSTPHESTGQTPHRMVYGEEMQFPLNFITSNIEEDPEETCLFTTDYVLDLQENLREIHDLAREHLRGAAERQQKIYDGTVRNQNYSVGNLVWRNQKKNIPGRKSKIARHWTGPWIIIEKLSDILFRIKFSKNSVPVIVHGDNLKPYLGQRVIDWFEPPNAESTGNSHDIDFPDLEDYATPCNAQRENPAESPPIRDHDDNVSSNQDAWDPPGDLRDPGSRIRSEISERPTMREPDAQSRRKIQRPKKFDDYILDIQEELINKMSSVKYNCKDCFREFTNKKNLKRHENTFHSVNAKVVWCDECGMHFFRRDHLTNHLRVMHNVTLIEARERARETMFEYARREDLPETSGIKRSVEISENEDEEPQVKVRIVDGDEIEDRNEENDNEILNSHYSDTDDEQESVDEIYMSDEIEEEIVIENDEEIVIENGEEVVTEDDEELTNNQKETVDIELISLTLVQKTVTNTGGDKTVTKEQHISTSRHFDADFPWKDFTRYMLQQIEAHVREGPNNATVERLDDDDE